MVVWWCNRFTRFDLCWFFDSKRWHLARHHDNPRIALQYSISYYILSLWRRAALSRIVCVCVSVYRHERIVWPFGGSPRRRRRQTSKIKKKKDFLLAGVQSILLYLLPCCECDWTKSRSPSRRYGYIERGQRQPARSVSRFHRDFLFFYAPHSQHLSHNVKASCAATSAIPACTLAEVTRARRVSFASELKANIERITMRFNYFPRRHTHTQHASSSRLAVERISFDNEWLAAGSKETRCRFSIQFLFCLISFLFLF